MEVTFTRGHHSATTLAAFGDRFPVFYRERENTALFGNHWESVLCTNGNQAMLHIISRSPIGRTGLWDVEPFFGYAGPLLTSSEPSFIKAALQAYSRACMSEGIIAEIVRFDPVARNHHPFSDLHNIEVVESRKIAYVTLSAPDTPNRLQTYSGSCRRQIRAASSKFRFMEMQNTVRDWGRFATLYKHSLARNHAARRWHLSAEALERMRECPDISLWGVLGGADGDALISATIVFADDRTVHTLFVANESPDILCGACDLLMHSVIEAYSHRGHQSLCLGGGRTDADDDALLKFKRKFANGRLHNLPVGFLPHDPVAIDRLSRCTSVSTAEAGYLPSNALAAQRMIYRSCRMFSDEKDFAYTSNNGI